MVDNKNNSYMYKRKGLLFLICIGAIFFVFISPSSTSAEEVGESIQAPITFTASDPVTAADFTVTVSGGTLDSLSCGGSGFSNLASSGNNCVVFNPSGATTGTIATATVSATSPGTLVVVVTGTLSTSGGGPPGSGQLNGQSYTITAVTATPTTTSTPTLTPAQTISTTPTATNTLSPSTNTPTPTLSGSSPSLPQSGSLEFTVVFLSGLSGLMFVGFLLLTRV